MTDIKRGSIYVLAAMALVFVIAAGCGSDDTSDNATQPVIDTVPPAIPGGLGASTRGTDSVQLSWAANTVDSDLAGYIIYRSENASSGYRPMHQDLMTSNSWTDPTVAEGHTYWYSISARDVSNNESARSASFSITVPEQTDLVPAGD